MIDDDLPDRMGRHFSGQPLRWPATDLAHAEHTVQTAARAIRLFYYRQLALLRQIPHLALQADGRGGWNDNFYRAYHICRYPIHQEHETWGSYDIWIELRCGDLLAVSSSPREYYLTGDATIYFGGESFFRPATDDEVYIKLGHQPAGLRFDPAALAALLKAGIKHAYHNEPTLLAQALEMKARSKVELARLMAQLPMKAVLQALRENGFEV